MYMIQLFLTLTLWGGYYCFYTILWKMTIFHRIFLKKGGNLLSSHGIRDLGRHDFSWVEGKRLLQDPWEGRRLYLGYPLMVPALLIIILIMMMIVITTPLLLLWITFVDYYTSCISVLYNDIYRKEWYWNTGFLINTGIIVSWSIHWKRKHISCLLIWIYTFFISWYLLSYSKCKKNHMGKNNQGEWFLIALTQRVRSTLGVLIHSLVLGCPNLVI